MKNIRHLIVLAALAVAGVAWGAVSAYSASGAYLFPIRPGMQEWKDFKTHAEMVDATQVPEELLQKMSTEALIETCLDYPLLMDFAMYDTMQQGFRAVVAQFNGLQELLRRDDSRAKLVGKYQATSARDAVEKTENSTGDHFIFRLAFLEFILAQEEVLAGSSSDDRKKIVKIALTRFEEKTRYPEQYGAAGISSTGFLLKKAMRSSDSASKRTGKMETEKDVPPVIMQIVSEAKAYVAD